MFQNIMRRIFTKKIFFLVFSLVIIPSRGWSYGAGNVEKDGLPIIQINADTHQPLIWNVEHGAVQDGRPFIGISPSQVDAFCKANPGGNPPGGGGSGGCSLNPFIREARAESISSNAEAIPLISEVYGRWHDQAGAFGGDVSFISTTPGTPLNDGGDVNICNADQFIDFLTPITSLDDPRICGCLPPAKKPASCTAACVNPIIFDTNGELTVLLGGNLYTTLGLTALVRVEGATSHRAVGFNMVINGHCFDHTQDKNCLSTFDTNDIKAVLMHEAGHSLGLAHSQVNLPKNYDSAKHTIDNPAEMTTMYPGLYSSAQSTAMLDLNLDDLMGYAHLYGAPKAPFCTVTGVATDQGTGKGLRCVEIVARSQTDGNINAVSFVSGSEAINDGVPGAVHNSCTAIGAECGRFTILVPATGQYTLEVNSLPPGGAGGASSVGPCTNPPQVSNVNFPAPGKVINCTAGKTLDCSKGDFGCPQVTIK